MWDAVQYFTTLNSKLKLTRNKYFLCRVTGLANLEDLINSSQKHQNFTAVDDSDDGVTVRKGGGYFNRRSVVVYLLKKYNFKSQEDRAEKLTEVRKVYSRFLSRLIRDSNTLPELTYLDKSRIPYHEVPGFFAAGTAGLYFIITIDEPVDLQFVDDHWDETTEP